MMMTMTLLAARAALVLGTAMVATLLLRRASASLRHLVLLASFVAVLVMPILSVITPTWHLASSPVVRAEGPNVEPMLRSSALASSTMEVTPPIESRTADGAAATNDGAWSSLPRPSMPAALATLWALGAVALLARLAFGLRRARYLASAASPIDDARIASLLVAARAAIDAREVSLRVSAAIDVPSVTGILEPVILVPHAALAWSDERWRVVLMHEIAHVRRRDCLAQILVAIGCALHWFNPLAWIAARSMRGERELAADDAVIAAGTRATSYASHLVAIAAASSENAVPAGALAMAHRSQLERRVRALVVAARTTRRDAGSTRVGAMLAVAGVALLVACASPDTAPAPSTAHVLPSIAPATTPRPTTMLADSVARFVGAAASRVELTIDPGVQSIVDDEMARVVGEWEPAAANIVVVDPATGAIVAVAGRSPNNDPLLAIQRAIVPASTFKTITFAAAIDEGTVTPDKKIFCDNGQHAYGKRVLHDHASFGWLDVTQILAVSSNIGAAKVYETLGGERAARWFTVFHFGERPPVQVADAATGSFPSPIPLDPFDAATVTMGEAVTASPLQVAAAYAAIANDGVYNAPTLVRRVIGDDGRATWEHRPTHERIVKSTTAHAVMAMLEQVVTSDQGTGHAAHVDGFRVAGKTGTGYLSDATPGEPERTYSTFVGAIPADRPRFVILVGVDTPKRGESGGGKIAAPAFARIASRAMRE